MKNRIENYLSKIAGKDDAIDIAPANRMEAALNDIAENGSGGSGGGGGAFVINCTYQNTSHDVVINEKTIDQSFDDIVSAIKNGIHPTLVYSFLDDDGNVQSTDVFTQFYYRKSVQEHQLAFYNMAIYVDDIREKEPITLFAIEIKKEGSQTTFDFSNADISII